MGHIARYYFQGFIVFCVATAVFANSQLFALDKDQAIEASGYKTRKDVEGVIQALEGMQMKNSLAHPQGDKIIRKEDHVGIIDCYISRVENGKLEVKKRIPKEELAKNMPLRHNLSQMPV